MNILSFFLKFFRKRIYVFRYTYKTSRKSIAIEKVEAWTLKQAIIKLEKIDYDKERFDLIFEKANWK